MPQSSRRLVQSVIVLACFTFPHGGCGDIAKMSLNDAVQKIGVSVVAGSTDDGMRKIFEQANAACPRRMDAFTTLEEVEMIDDSRVEFRYVVNEAGKQLTSRMDPREMKKNAVENMKGNAMAVAIADRDLSIQHIYEDSTGNHILSYTINRAVLNGEPEPVAKKRFNPFDVKAVVESALFAAPQTKSSVAEEVMPQEIKPARTNNNPAGLRSNPFFQPQP